MQADVQHIFEILTQFHIAGAPGLAAPILSDCLMIIGRGADLRKNAASPELRALDPIELRLTALQNIEQALTAICFVAKKDLPQVIRLIANLDPEEKYAKIRFEALSVVMKSYGYKTTEEF